MAGHEIEKGEVNVQAPTERLHDDIRKEVNVLQTILNVNQNVLRSIKNVNFLGRMKNK